MRQSWILGVVLMTTLSLGVSTASAGTNVWRWLGLGFGPGYHATSNGHYGGHGYAVPTYAAQPIPAQPAADHSHHSLPSVNHPAPGTPTPASQPTLAAPQHDRPSAAAAPKTLPWSAR